MADKKCSGFYAAGGVLLLAVLWMLYAWITQLGQGLDVTGLGDWGVSGGVPWGLYVAAFLWFDGIALGGMLLSTSIRIGRLKAYYPAARIAEVLAVITMGVGGLMLLFDIGRPERFLNLLLYLPFRISSSPLAMDFATVSVFMVLGILYVLQNRNPGKEGSRILPLALMVLSLAMAGLVVPALFGTISAQEGWFSTVLGPLFLVAALATGTTATLLVAGMYRKCGCKGFTDEVIGGLSKALFLSLAGYVYLSLVEGLMGHASGALWVKTVLLLGVMALYLGYTWFTGTIRTPGMLVTQVIPVLVLVAFFAKRYVLVVPTFLSSRLPYLAGSYAPSWVEWSLVLGAMSLAALVFMLYDRMDPVAGRA